MKLKWIFLTVPIGIFLTAAVFVGPIMSDVETPEYKILKTEGNIQLRRYNPMIIALVNVNGTRRDAIGKGFRLLADYIFGDNVGQRTISDPAGTRESIKIAMTAPVQQQSVDSGWQISFVMPSEYTTGTLPSPTNKLITIRTEDSRDFFTITFSGINSDQNIEKNQNILSKYLKVNNISTSSKPIYAFYDPPWTLAFLRRNEILIARD